MGKVFFRKKISNLLIIGVQKGGTTALYELLCQFPEFCGSKDKEASFFVKDIFFKQGLKWYSRQFETCTHEAVRFEATPAYFYYPYVPRRIFNFNKNMKFIVIFRDPAERCYSAWNMFRRFHETCAEEIYQQFTIHANEPTRKAIKKLLFVDQFPSFRQAVLDDIVRYESQLNEFEPSFVRRGIYTDQLSNYLEYFGIDHFLFLEQIDLKNPKALLQKIAAFMENDIDFEKSGRNYLIKSNVGEYQTMDSEVRETLLILKDFYRPFNENLFTQIGMRFDWND